MSRSLHSSTEHLDSPRAYFTNSREQLPFTSWIGKTSLNTRSNPTSVRSAPLPSGCRSDANARVWISRRCGIGIPSSSLANDSTGSVFVMSRPHANANKGPSPPIGAPTGGETEGLGEASWNVAGPLLQFDGRALRFELLLDFLGFLLGHAFLHGAGRTLHQVLGLLQAEVGDRPDLFDHLDLLFPGALEDDREFGLFLGGRGRRPCPRPRPTRARRRRGDRRRDRDAELLLERLDQLR